MRRREFLDLAVAAGVVGVAAVIGLAGTSRTPTPAPSPTPTASPSPTSHPGPCQPGSKQPVKCGMASLPRRSRSFLADLLKARES